MNAFIRVRPNPREIEAEDTTTYHEIVTQTQAWAEALTVVSKAFSGRGCALSRDIIGNKNNKDKKGSLQEVQGPL